MLHSSSRLVTLCLSVVLFPATKKFERGEVGERLVGTDVVVGVFPAAQLLVEASQFGGVGLHLIELLVVGTMGALDVGVELRRLGCRTNRGISFCWQASSNSAANSLPPSTCRAPTRNGRRSSRVSRKRAAASEVARRCTSTTSQRETTSRALKCFRITPRRRRSSLVSISTRSPGC